MTASSRIAKLLAGVAAVAAHGAVALGLTLPDPIEVAGGAGIAEVRLGNGFADMAVGTMQAQTPDQAQAARPLDTINAAQAKPVSPAPAPDAATAVQPQAQAAVAPKSAETAPRPERLTAEPERENGAVSTSLRPRPRSAQVEKTARATQPQTRAKPERQTSQGNADRNMRAGDSAGTETATATARGTGGTAKAAGNAAISNYPGQVMRKLSRAGKPRVNARGQAVVAFTVASNGGLQALTLARSSGSSALDRAALRLVRSAAPFPQPPSGARRSFSIGIKGR